MFRYFWLKRRRAEKTSTESWKCYIPFDAFFKVVGARISIRFSNFFEVSGVKLYGQRKLRNELQKVVLLFQNFPPSTYANKLFLNRLQLRNTTPPNKNCGAVQQHDRSRKTGNFEIQPNRLKCKIRASLQRMIFSVTK